MSISYRLRYAIADRMRAHPWPYLPLVRRLRHDADGRPKAVTRDTQLVIEGYPRSGNTFARIAFEMCQPTPGAVRLAHHLHAPAQVLAAARLGVPCLVLIREPDEAVLSQVVREPRLDLRTALASYARFHAAIRPAREAFVLARFETVTREHGSAIAAVNRKFGTTFGVGRGTMDDLTAIRARVDEHDAALGKAEHRRGRPTAARDRAKAALRDELNTASARRVRERAWNVYRLLAETAEV